MVQQDIVMAQQIVSRSIYNFGSDKNFHKASRIYKASNERIQDYCSYFSDKEKILSVIGSGDQVLNYIYDDAKEIDVFDISVFPKYFMYLKIAAIKALTREEYIDFFYITSNKDEYYYELYERITVFLSDEVYEFWEGLFNFFEWKEIYNSTLFSSEPYSSSNCIKQNRFLQSDDNYERLKERIDKVVIKTYDGDICDLLDKLRTDYDLVYLSNLIYYIDFDRYKRLLGDINMSDKGVALTYLYKIKEEIFSKFGNEHYKFERIPDSDAYVLTYHK